MKKIKEIRSGIAAGTYDEKLSYLYCRPASMMQSYRDRVTRVLDGYLTRFGMGEDSCAAVFSAPGRTELGGNHTDHQGGKVLTGSVDLDALACAAPNGTTKVNLYSEGYGLTTLDCTRLAIVEGEKNTTVAILRGILAKIAEKGYPVSGFDAYMISDVPGGSGLSSSACIEILLAEIVNHLFCGDQITAIEMAQIGQYAENVYFGKPSGLLDQIGCAFGGVVAVDFRDASMPVCQQIDFNLAEEGYAMCIIDTGADHKDLTDDYAAIPTEMRSVAAQFGKEILSQVEETQVIEHYGEICRKCGDRAALRALHYYADCGRVPQQVAALQKKDFQEYLRLVNESGNSSILCLQNIATFRNVQDQPVSTALAMAQYALKGHGAVRVHGGGFAGTIQAYVAVDKLKDFTEMMDHFLGEGACKLTYIRPVGGCVLM